MGACYVASSPPSLLHARTRFYHLNPLAMGHTNLELAICQLGTISRRQPQGSERQALCCADRVASLALQLPQTDHERGHKLPLDLGRHRGGALHRRAELQAQAAHSLISLRAQILSRPYSGTHPSTPSQWLEQVQHPRCDLLRARHQQHGPGVSASANRREACLM